jgi:PLP dependent protein
MDSIAARIDTVRERIAAAARHAGRPDAEIRLVGVTKTHPPEVVARALAAGLTDFGENRVQEAEAKVAALAAQRGRITWHLIGHLQRNKAKKAAELFDVVHSIDSMRLAQALDRAVEETKRQGDKETRRQGDKGTLVPFDHPVTLSPPHLVTEGRLPVLLQVNVSGEVSKEGFALAGWEERRALFDAFLGEVAALLALPHLRIRGLMTIAPWSADPEAARPVFRSTRRLRDRLAQHFQGDWAELSMGMTDDFAVAIEEGATLVRVGRAIFGER